MSEPKVNVLLVDDQPNNLLALEALLGGEDRNLVRARSGEEALMRILDDDFAVILMDVQMPGMDGFETAALIRDRDRSKHTPIIFLTAFQSTDVRSSRATPSARSTTSPSRSCPRCCGRRSPSSSTSSGRPSRSSARRSS